MEYELEQYKIIAQCFDNLNDYDNAIIYYEKLLPSSDYTIYGNLARLYGEKYLYGEKDKQFYYLNKAFILNPNSLTTLMNLALLYEKFGYIKETYSCFNKLIELNKMTDQLKFVYGGFLIRQGKFKEGYTYYKFRYKTEEEFPKLKNRWNGEDLKDKTLLVRYEQGYGDTFMFARFIKDIPYNIKIVVQDDLYEFFKYNYENVYPESIEDQLQYDYFIPFMDLILLLEIEPNNIPYKEGYLKVREEKIKECKKYLNKNNKLKIGISYQGDKSGKRICRDILLKELYKIKNENIELYCLQKEDRDNQLKDFQDIIKPELNSWEDTAACMENLDLVISTDNCILNLAGALGIKTFGLFNKYPESRWFKLQEDVGWYNIKPFQCKKFNYWEPVVEEIRQEISKIIYGRVL